MSELNENITRACEKIANSLSQNEDEYGDTLQEGLTKVLEMTAGHKDSYYIEYAKRRMQNFLRKERKLINNFVSFQEGIDEGQIIKSRYGYKTPVRESFDGCGDHEE